MLAAALVGVGFNIKFAETLVVLPAFVAPTSPRPSPLARKWLHLLCAAGVLTAVSLSWVLAVDANT